MTTQEQYIERLKEMVSAEFGRSIITPDDCIALSNVVGEVVGVSVDVEALEQLFLVGSDYTTPRPIVLSSLARYVGFTGWSDFCTARDITPADDHDAIPVARRWGVIGLTAIAVIVVIISAIAIIRSSNSEENEILVVDSRFRGVEARWVARTEEYCNREREHYNSREPERYNRHVDKFISKYSAYMHKNVKRNIENYAIQNKITVDNDTIDEAAEIIIEKCLDMCEDIKIK